MTRARGEPSGLLSHTGTLRGHARDYPATAEASEAVSAGFHYGLLGSHAGGAGWGCLCSVVSDRISE
jgi:hypothetical protein